MLRVQAPDLQRGVAERNVGISFLQAFAAVVLQRGTQFCAQGG